ncbi:MerR family transcriptional regulator [Haloplasma contractile]|uniref:PTS system fructose-specific IIA component protein n=1 Tax=Haloplasma contractile SSD-17B TaxID=1033810 RepID=U2E0D5_9MOLU|nr:MerR family transcriptional regulator [Haloplasma contractile]ERJ13887.1 PTS system fructose-specific IIA component protein [Haloplasma contractile SSD-17B]
MKIGEFAKRNEISKDTIRHYIDLGLLFPLKNGSHYSFDEKSEQELNDIITFKSMGFTLQEIKNIFDFKRIDNLSHAQATDYYNQFFKTKYKEIENEIKTLHHTKKQLKEKIDELSNYKPKEYHKIGVDVSVLPKLSCPDCKRSLSLNSGNIINNQILEGELVCSSCKKVYTISDGILCGKNLVEYPSVKEDHIVDYIRETPSNYINHIYKGRVWFERNVDFKLFNDSTILELGVGFGYFLRIIYNDLPDSAIYFAVDHNIGMLRYLKKLLERVNVKKNIVFVCTDFLEIPLQDHTVDTIIDFAGSSNYAFNNKQFLLEEVKNLFKEDVSLIGSYLMFNKFKRDTQISPGHRHNFIKKQVREQIERLKFKVVSDISSDIQTEGGKYETYIQEGEEVFSYFMYGIRKT